MADRADAATAAAIRRATAAAQAQMHTLDDAAMGELVRIYRAAADDVEGRIRTAAAAGGTGQVELAALAELKRDIEAVLSQLGQARDLLLDSALQQAAELGMRPLTGPGLAATGRAAQAVVSVGEAAGLVSDAVNFVRTFRAEDGLSLSDRLWRVDRSAKDAVLGTIEQAVVQGWSADKAAAEFLYRGQPVPAATQTAQRAADVANVVRAADVLRDDKTGCLAQVERVLRTEINRAHGEAYASGAEKAPGFVGFRFLLSPQHPRHDICDLLAAQNRYGLGPGVYPDRKRTPWPAHPNTLSFIVAVFEEQVTQADRDGQETELQALQRLAPEVRAGVLGQTKATYFDKGLLTRGMIRSPLKRVDQRLRRTGRLPTVQG
jgi:hypothetical protein